MPTEDEVRLLEILRESAAKVRQAAEAVGDEVARRKPRSDCWSILECIEHVIFVDRAFGSRIPAGETGLAPVRDVQKEEALMAQVSARRARVKGPPQAEPTGRFHTVAEALAALSESEEHLSKSLSEAVPKLRYLKVNHPVLGELTGYESYLVLAAHRIRHAAQIAEIRYELLGS